MHHGVHHSTVRTPSSRNCRTIPGASGNWWGLNSQVLYCVDQGESITIASSAISLRRNPTQSSITSSWRSWMSRLFQKPYPHSGSSAGRPVARQNARSRAAGVGAQNSVTRSGPAAARVDSAMREPDRSNCVPLASVRIQAP